jgi:hypothetical protein
LTVVDAATGEPVPARVGLYAAEGGRMPLPSTDAVSVHRFADEVRMQWLTPKGAWPLEHRSIFHIAGRYAAKAPAGAYDLVVTRGPEFRMHRSRVQLAADARNDVVVRLDRYEDMPAAGWYSGESHVHLMRDRTEDMDVWNLLAAEDLYVSNLVEMGNITTTYFPQPSWGREGIFSHGGRFLVSGQEDPRTVMRGHTLHWNTGVHAHMEDSFFRYHTVFEKTRATGAVTGYAHRGEGFNGERGLATDVPFGLVEFIEVLQSGRINTDIWYSFLNLGYRLGAGQQPPRDSHDRRRARPALLHDEERSARAAAARARVDALLGVPRQRRHETGRDSVRARALLVRRGRDEPGGPRVAGDRDPCDGDRGPLGRVVRDGAVGRSAAPREHAARWGRRFNRGANQHPQQLAEPRGLHRHRSLHERQERHRRAARPRAPVVRAQLDHARQVRAVRLAGSRSRQLFMARARP